MNVSPPPPSQSLLECVWLYPAAEGVGKGGVVDERETVEVKPGDQNVNRIVKEAGRHYGR